jgi:hypothetical protein
LSPSGAKEVLEAHLALDRKELSRVLQDVRERASANLDVSRRVRERPSAWLAGALLLGFWLGARR